MIFLKKRFLIPILAIITITIYVITSFFIIKDYGITLDDVEQFGVGHKVVEYFQTGHVNYQDDLPTIEGHPNFYNDIVKTRPHHIWPFPPILSVLTCKLFFQNLQILDPIPAHHIIIPILTAIFMLVFFFFMKRYWGNIAAFIAMLSLLTMPRFFGHSMSNIKDLPELLFFSIAIFYFFDWWIQNKIKYLYYFFAALGLALATKADAMLIPPIIFLWLIPYFAKQIKNDGSVKLRTLLHVAIGSSITGLIIILNYPQLQPGYYENIKEYLIGAPKFIYTYFRYIIGIGTDSASSWNLYAFKQIFYTTPTWMLVFFIIGLIFTIFKNKKFSSKTMFNVKEKFNVNSLLLIWLFFPLLRHCLPRANHYDGLRHIIIFMVPFVIVITIGIIKTAKFLSVKLKLNRNVTYLACAMLVILPNIYHLITLHPFQTTFYNYVTGGLKGAQEKDIPFSSDYWFISNQKLGEWLDKNGKQNANIYGHYLNYHIKRKDFKKINLSFNRSNFKITNLNTIPNNTYIVIIPRRWYRIDKKIPLINESIPEIKKLQIAHQIKRQNGIIATIYYKPPFAKASAHKSDGTTIFSK